MVVHHPRLAWDAARLFAASLESEPVYGWLGGELGRVFGPAYAGALAESRARLWASERPDARQVEAGLWRARLDDLLDAHPELVPAVRDLIGAGLVRLAQAPPPLVPVRAPAAPRVIELGRLD